MSISHPSHVSEVEHSGKNQFHILVSKIDGILPPETPLPVRILQEIAIHGNILSVSKEVYQEQKQNISTEQIRTAVTMYLMRYIETLIVNTRDADVKLADLSDIQKKRIAFGVKKRELEQDVKKQQELKKAMGDEYHDFLLIPTEEVIDEYIAEMEL